jgi:hypothetical protein
MIPRFAVIPTRDRHELLRDCVTSLLDQIDAVFVIDNLSDPPIDPIDLSDATWVGALRCDLDPPNIQRLWNIGLQMAEQAAAGAAEWDVVVLNSDVVCPPLFVSTLSREMRSTSAVLAYPDQSGAFPQPLLHTTPGPVDLRTRITGYAYMLRGEAGMTLDDQFGWWYGDDDLDWRCREAGGSLLVPGIPVEHRLPNESMARDPRLPEQAGIDRTTFIAKWGRAPH